MPVSSPSKVRFGSGGIGDSENAGNRTPSAPPPSVHSDGLNILAVCPSVALSVETPRFSGRASFFELGRGRAQRQTEQVRETGVRSSGSQTNVKWRDARLLPRPIGNSALDRHVAATHVAVSGSAASECSLRAGETRPCRQHRSSPLQLQLLLVHILFHPSQICLDQLSAASCADGQRAPER